MLMKKILLLLTLLMSSFNIFADNIAQINNDDNISTIYINMPATIHIIKSDTTNIEIQTSDEYIKKYISYNISDDGIATLSINSRFLDESYNITEKDILIAVYTKNTDLIIKTPKTFTIKKWRKD